MGSLEPYIQYAWDDPVTKLLSCIWYLDVQLRLTFLNRKYTDLPFFKL